MKETKFDFNSSPCTSKEQSERLLRLGVCKETADMTWFRRSKNADWESSTISYQEWVEEILPIGNGYTLEDIIPAWSLHRLIEMLPEYVKGRGLLSFGKYGLDYSEGYGYVGYGNVDADGLYASIINSIEFLTKKGHFNKEYLLCEK